MQGSNPAYYFSPDLVDLIFIMQIYNIIVGKMIYKQG